MNPSHTKLIGLDLDGTLLTPDKTITDRTREAIRRCAEQGILLVPVTGRPYHGLPACVNEITQFHYAIASNGAVIRDTDHGETLAAHRIPPETSAQILSAARGLDVNLEIFQNGYGYTTQESYDRRLAKYRGTPILSYFTDSRVPLPDEDALSALCHTPAEGISILCRQRAVRHALHQKLLAFPDIQIVYPGPLELEINHALADKGHALLALAKHRNIPPDAILAIGDGDNDRTMLSQAAIGIAMGNAAARLRSLAHYVTQDNAHDGVALVLEQLAAR